MRKRLTVVCISTIIMSCGGQVKEQDMPVACSGLDWDNIGYQTGMKGKSVRAFDRYRDACGDQLESTAISLFQDGYVRAMIDYCSEDHGYKIGFSGVNNPDICPYELRHKFNAGYKLGAIKRREQVKEIDRLREDQDREDVNRTSSNTQAGPM